MSTTGIILAAGKGTRMKSELPKVLCTANGRPLLRYVIDALRQAGVEQLIVVIGYRGELVQAELADEPDVQFAWQTEQLGTGHAVMMAAPLLPPTAGAVVVVAGDSMLQPSSVRALLAEFRQQPTGVLLGTLQHSNPQGLGRIVRDQEGNFLRIVEEKDATPREREICEVNMSTYVFDAVALREGLAVLKPENEQKEYYLTDLPGILLRQGLRVAALPILKPIEALSVNTVEQLADVEAALLNNRS
jgi:bifunctional UDP-N-acetylglucosamine pyrophosphorylase/glucosamine-1-phosphate N-acetyltransferase/UDP-N-acetylglucosamine pyrophosphorylase